MITIASSLALSACTICMAPTAELPHVPPAPVSAAETPLYLELSKEYDAMLAAPEPSTTSTVAPMLADDDHTFSYTFLEVGATSFDIDQWDEDAEQYYGRAQIGMFDFLYIFAGYENLSADFNDTSTDLLRAGAGVHFTVAPKLDLVGDIAWLWNDVDSDLSVLDDTTHGYEVHAGARWMPFEWEGGGLEFAGGGVYIDLDNRVASDDEVWGWEAGVRVHFLKMLSLGAMYSELDDDDAISANLRVSF